MAVGGPVAARLVVGVVLLTVASGCAGSDSEPDTWSDLTAFVRGLAPADRSEAIERFVGRHRGTPIVEDGTRLVFLVHDDADRPPRIVGDFNAWAAIPGGVDPQIGVMARIEGTSWWSLEAETDTDARIEYVVFFDDDDVRPDPLNPHRVDAAAGPRSEVRLPGWIPQPEIDDTSAVPRGEVVAGEFASRALDASLRVWYYVPAGYAVSGETRYPSVYFLDGGNYVERMDVPRVLDRLIAADRIQPVIGVFVEPRDRVEEYGRSADWLRFAARELVPAVAIRYRTRAGSSHRVLVGSSYGAVGVVRLALAYPDVFGRLAAVAPPADAVTALASAGTGTARESSRRWFVLGGRFDHLLDDARRLRDLLDETGERVAYLEVPEGHSTETFRGHLDDALSALLAPVSSGGGD